ncbi:MAG: DNA-protecting protein DprA [Acidobacteria bacterium]|nr:DNA-protecting protein DprA [Acidobacteriota bacterium]
MIPGRGAGRTARTIERGDPEFPALLAEIEGAPHRLFVIGRRLCTLPPCVAVVGSRTPTAYGREVARALTRDLALAGLCVVSGMARGVDSEAHLGALEAGGPTVAVLAGGVEVPYPATNRRLYERIAEGGAVVSEHPARTPSLAYRFPERNRIIAGMCLGVVVVQAAEKSGALITARLANESGRDVFAVPGDVRSDRSAGTHRLIYDGARVCRGASDVIDEVGKAAGLLGMRLAPPSPEAGLSEDEARVLAAVGREPARVETILVRCALAAAAASRVLTRLELAGLVARGPGGAYHRTR